MDDPDNFVQKKAQELYNKSLKIKKKSQPSRALYIVLKKVKCDFEPKFVDLRKAEHYSEEYTKVNRLQRVPVIDHNGFILTESVAILKYLARENIIPESLYPKDSKQQARVEEFLEWQHIGLRPPHRYVLQSYGMAGFDPKEKFPNIAAWWKKDQDHFNPYYDEAHESKAGKKSEIGQRLSSAGQARENNLYHDYDKPVKSADESRDPREPIITYKRNSKSKLNTLCHLLETKGISESVDNSVLPKKNCIEMNELKSEDNAERNVFKNNSQFNNFKSKLEEEPKDTVDLTVSDQNENDDKEEKYSTYKRHIMETKETIRDYRPPDKNIRDINTQENKTLPGSNKPSQRTYNFNSGYKTQGNTVPRTWSEMDSQNKLISIKHNLPLQALREREKYKALKKIIIPLTRSQSRPTPYPHAVQVQSIHTQTDYVFSETKEDHELLQFLKTNGIARERLVERFLESNEDINNNKEELNNRETSKPEDNNAPIADHVLETILIQSDKNKSIINKSKQNVMQKTMMSPKKKAVPFLTETLPENNNMNHRTAVYDEWPSRIHNNVKTMQFSRNPEEIRSQSVNQQHQSGNYQSLSTGNNENRFVEEPQFDNRMRIAPNQISPPRMNQLPRVYQSMNTTRLPLPVGRMPVQQNIRPQYMEQYWSAEQYTHLETPQNYSHLPLPNHDQYKPPMYYSAFQPTESEYRHEQNNARYLEEQRIFKQLDLQKKAWESRLINFPNSAWI